MIADRQVMCSGGWVKKKKSCISHEHLYAAVPHLTRYRAIPVRTTAVVLMLPSTHMESVLVYVFNSYSLSLEFDN